MIRALSISILCPALVAAGCTRKEIIDMPATHAEITVSLGDFSGSVKVPLESAFDNIKAEISGFDWQIVATARAEVSDNKVVLSLPADIPSDGLCKVARDTWDDYEGFWPAEGVSDREAKVAGLGDIIACKGDTPVGRLYLTDRDGEAASVDPRYHIYYLYSDRAVGLSGYNLVREGQSRSFRYEASFEAGWNAYANVAYFTDDPYRDPPPSLCTTDLPEGLDFRWRFESWK